MKYSIPFLLQNADNIPVFKVTTRFFFISSPCHITDTLRQMDQLFHTGKTVLAVLLIY